MVGSSGTQGGAPVVIPDCELGQALSEKGCRDIIVNNGEGGEDNLRKVFAASRCRLVYDRLKAANRRMREYLRIPGHDLREGLLRVQAECHLRDEHIEACRSAGFFERVGGGESLEHFLEAQSACHELADLYRRRIAAGYTSAPR